MVMSKYIFICKFKKETFFTEVQKHFFLNQRLRVSPYNAKMSETGQITSSTCASCSGQIGWPTSEEPKETVPLIQKPGL